MNTSMVASNYFLFHNNHSFINHHHHVARSAQISQSLSSHPSLSSVVSGRSSFRNGTELLYVGSSWSSCLCSSTWMSPREYITYDLVPRSPAVFCMPCSRNFDSFRDVVVGGRTAAALWGAASRTCSILLAGFLPSCRQSFFSIRSVGVHVVHQHDRCMEETAFYFIGQVWLPYDR